MASVNFADVKKIVIPEGDVRRITQTSDGTVLWEKTADYTYVVQGDWSSWKDGSYRVCKGVPGNLWNAYPYYRVRIEEPVSLPASSFTYGLKVHTGTIGLVRMNTSAAGMSGFVAIPITSDGSTLTIGTIDTGWKNKISSTESYPWIATNYSSVYSPGDSDWYDFFGGGTDLVAMVMNSLKIIIENANYPY